MSDLATVLKQLEAIESSFATFEEKAKEEMGNAVSLSAETKAALDKLGQTQHELAERLVLIEQRAPTGSLDGSPEKSLADKLAEDADYRAFCDKRAGKFFMEIKANTSTGSDTNVAPDRKPGVVPGDFEILTLESVIPAIPTSSNAIEYTREASFTNLAAEAAENTAKAQSSLTWALNTMPVSTVAHWLKISRQLAMDNVALAAYMNTRMAYGVNQRVETQLGAGDGVAPNISGLLDAGNFTAHGFAAAALGTLAKVNLVTKIIGSLWASGGIPTAILLNPTDWAQIQVDITDSSVNAARVDYSNGIQPRLNGLQVIQSNGITADNILVGDFRQAATIHNREGVTVEMSEHDDTNFQSNLITIRAERRLALTVERPSMIIGGDLTPL